MLIFLRIFKIISRNAKKKKKECIEKQGRNKGTMET